jgi:chromosome segregation ATPase
LSSQAKHAQAEEQMHELESKNRVLEAACSRLEEEAAAWFDQLEQLKAEAARAAEELEQAEADKSDLKETVGRLQERRNSLGQYRYCAGFVRQKRCKKVPSFMKQERWHLLPPFLTTGNKPGTSHCVTYNG